MTEFVMDANKILFSNRKRNPTRPWFLRMIRELEKRGQDDNVRIVMRPNLWEKIAYLYSFEDYIYKQSRVYYTACAENQQGRYTKYLTDNWLPIDNRMYPIITDSQADAATIRFERGGEVLGRICNIRTRIYKPGARIDND